MHHGDGQVSRGIRSQLRRSVRSFRSTSLFGTISSSGLTQSSSFPDLISVARIKNCGIPVHNL